MDNNLNFKEILVRKPYFRPTPAGYLDHGKPYFEDGSAFMPDDQLKQQIYTEEDFIRELYPSSHAIYDHIRFPDIIKEDPDNEGKYYLQPVTRYAVAFQNVIKTKHVTHLCGNDMQFELSGKAETEEKEEKRNEKLLDIIQFWLDKDLEYHFYESVDGIMSVANAAIITSIRNNKVYYKTLSYLNGDRLYPHYDSITGELALFARQYDDYDESGNILTKWVEIWDDEYIYRAKQSLDDSGIMTTIKKIFGIDGYKIISKEKHGFPFIPVAYHREKDGPCWSKVQNNIEDFEEAFSYLAENNKAYGFPIFYTNGDGEEIDIHGDINGSVKSIELYNKDAKAGFISPEDASAAFKSQLDMSYKLIYELSFTVQPPELKSGDLPGVAVKLLYSPAIEQAIVDAQKLSPFISKLMKMVRFGCGYEKGMITDYMSLDFIAYIEPYIHQNDTELFTNLATAVDRNFISRQTASERIKKFAKTDEIQRVWREDLEKRKRDRQDKIDEIKASSEEKIKQIKTQMSGQDINTGRGSSRTTDENGNRPGENNWDDWNATH